MERFCNNIVPLPSPFSLSFYISLSFFSSLFLSLFIHTHSLSQHKISLSFSPPVKFLFRLNINFIESDYVRHDTSTICFHSYYGGEERTVRWALVHGYPYEARR